MLGGALDVTPMNVELLSYEAPTYYGMLATPLTVSDVLLGHLMFMTMRACIEAA